MRIGSLFSGAGGLDMAVQSVFGGEVVWHSEIDKAASKVLAYRFPGVPNLGSVTEIDWATVEPVDVLCGGFPCQDVSAAGKRAGIKDGTRSGLWAVFADAIDALRPQYVVIENVRGLLSATAHRAVESDDAVMGDRSDRPVLRAIGAVVGDLADLSYVGGYTTVSAASVGAPHRRERVFIVGTAAHSRHDAGCPEQGFEHEEQTGRIGKPSHRVGDHHGKRTDGIAADPSRNGRDEGRPEPARLQRGFDAAVSGDAAGRVELLPTPCAQQSGNTPENHLAKKPGRNVVTDLAILVENGLLETGGALLPTPAASDGAGGKTSRSGDRKGELLLGGVVRTLLPTPNAQDGNGGGRYSSEGHQSTLPGEVRLLPTPRSSDCFGAGAHGEGGLDLRTTIALLCTPSASDGGGGHLNRSGDRQHEQLLPGQAREMATAWGKYEAAIRRWEQVVGPAPAPTEPNKNGKPRLSAAFSQWLMGWPAGWVTDPAIGISRNDQLRIVGNGVCSQQAVAALRYLLAVAQ